MIYSRVCFLSCVVVAFVGIYTPFIRVDKKKKDESIFGPQILMPICWL